MQLITYDQVKSKIIDIRKQKVILDNDVTELYGVETKKINQAVKRKSYEHRYSKKSRINC